MSNNKLKSINKLNIFFILLFSTVVIAITLEFYLRSLMPQISTMRLLIPSSIPGLVNELNPNTKIRFDGLYTKIPSTIIEISSQGLRDREYLYEKPKDTKRLAVIGDSIGFGWGVENSQCFPKLLEKMLNIPSRKYKYEVLNFSVPGYNLLQKIIASQKKTIRFNVDYILIHALSNDFEPPVFDGKNVFWYLFERLYIVKSLYFSSKVFLANFKQKIRQIDSSYCFKGVNNILPHFQSLISILRENNIKLFFVFDNISQYNLSGLGRLEDFLKNNNIDFIIIDKFPDWSQEVISKRDPHPNAKGHRIIAETLFSFLKRKIE